MYRSPAMATNGDASSLSSTFYSSGSGNERGTSATATTALHLPHHLSASLSHSLYLPFSPSLFLSFYKEKRRRKKKKEKKRKKGKGGEKVLEFFPLIHPPCPSQRRENEECKGNCVHARPWAQNHSHLTTYCSSGSCKSPKHTTT